MKTITMRKTHWTAALAVAAGLAGAVLGQTDLARAGTNGNWPIKITTSGTSQRAEGSLNDIRSGGDAADYIGCSYTTTNNWLECWAVKGGSTAPGSMYCITTTTLTNWISPVSRLNKASAVRIESTSSACKSISVWNESAYL
jgi:hypothetical protein